jgi:hypothetical protein
MTGARGWRWRERKEWAAPVLDGLGPDATVP